MARAVIGSKFKSQLLEECPAVPWQARCSGRVYENRR
jgi:hypothetical protein